MGKRTESRIRDKPILLLELLVQELGVVWAPSSLSVFLLPIYWNLWINCIKLKLQMSWFQKQQVLLLIKNIYCCCFVLGFFGFFFGCFFEFQDHDGWLEFLDVCFSYTVCGLQWNHIISAKGWFLIRDYQQDEQKVQCLLNKSEQLRLKSI